MVIKVKEVSIKNILEVLNVSVENLNITESETDEILTDRGVDSLVFIQMVLNLEKEFNLEIPDSKLILSEMDTINKIYAVLITLPQEATE